MVLVSTLISSFEPVQLLHNDSQRHKPNVIFHRLFEWVDAVEKMFKDSIDDCASSIIGGTIGANRRTRQPNQSPRRGETRAVSHRPAGGSRATRNFNPSANP